MAGSADAADAADAIETSITVATRDAVRYDAGVRDAACPPSSPEPSRGSPGSDGRTALAASLTRPAGPTLRLYAPGKNSF